METRVKYFLDRYAQFGEKVPEKIEIKPSLRVNTLKTQPQQVVSRLQGLGVKLTKIPWLHHAYVIDKTKFSLGAAEEFLLGYYYLQEAAAQFPVEVLDPRPGETILDCCAAPGGKTTQIAQHMENKGTLVALEMKQHRLLSLRNSLERLGISNTVAYHIDATKVASLEMKFDRILLDAPCSGNYAGDQNWFKKRSLQGILRNVSVQRQLITAALNVLKPGGVLVYSTCSLEPEENELNIQWMIDNHNVAIEPVVTTVGDPGLTNFMGKRLNEKIGLCRRFWPHKTKTEGFFVAKVRKK